MKSTSYLLVTLIAVGGCVTEPSVDEDGRDDSFIRDGKADTGGVVEGSPEALAVLQVANERSEEEMHDRGVSLRAAQNIVAVRLGDDAIAGTSDDVTYASLAQLDAVPYVGPHAFSRLLAYANELANSPPSATPITPPADLWNVASCSPIAWSQLVAKFAAGATRHDFGRPYVTASRHRRECNGITGCTPWQDGGAVLWVNTFRNDGYRLPMPSGSRGTVLMDLDVASGRIDIVASAPYGADNYYLFRCASVERTSTAALQCHVDVMNYRSELQPVFFSSERNVPRAKLEGRVCADGRFHFTTAVLGDLSNSPENLAQIALYGRLF